MPRQSTDQRNVLSRPLSPQRQTQSMSQEDDLHGVVNSMFESSRIRRDARRLGLADHRDVRRVEAEAEINKVFNDHEANALKRRREQVARLAGLLRDKDEAERCMVASFKMLEQAYLLRSAQLKTALGSRVAKLQ